MLRFILTVPFAVVSVLLVTPVFLIMIPVWSFNCLVNLFTRAFGPNPLPLSKVFEFDFEVGWKPRADLDAAYPDRFGDPCTVRTDSEGWMGPCTLEESDVVVFGDSFAFGYGVSIEDAYYSLTERCRVKAVGAPGYNMVQELVLMKRYADRLRGKLVLWFVYAENDLAENFNSCQQINGYPSPFVRRTGNSETWEIVTEHVAGARGPRTGEAPDLKILYTHICTPCLYSDRAFSAAEYLICEAKRVCNEAGAELVVFSVTAKEQVDRAGAERLRKRLEKRDTFDINYPDKRISEICRIQGVPWIDGLESLDLQDYKVRDNHWNRRGNRKVARTIDAYYAEILKKKKGGSEYGGRCFGVEGRQNH